MSELRTEDEQVAAIKNWWANNGRSLLIGIGLALAIVFGWQAYQNSVIQTKTEASGLYQQLVTEATKNNFDDEEADTLGFLANELKTKYTSTEYAVFAALFLAKESVGKKDYTAAKSELEWVISNTDDKRVKHIASARIARILSAEGKHEEALALLNSTLPQFEANFLELRGDINKRLGKTQEAIDAYSSAFILIKENPQALPLLAVKLSDLGVNPSTL